MPASPSGCPPKWAEAFSYLGASTVRGSLTQFPAEVLNASPATLNLAESSEFTSGLPLSSTVEPGRELILIAPSEGRASAWGPLTVTGGIGQSVTLSTSQATAFEEVESGSFRETENGIVLSISGYSSNGTRTVGPLTVACNLPATTLAEAPITTGSYNPAEAPRITGITPDSGSTAGGTSVTITGSYFNNVSAVEFGGQKASSFTVNSPNSITAVTPPYPNSEFPGAPGQRLKTVEVNVITPDYSPHLPEGGHFTYEGPCSPVESPFVAQVEPAEGPEAGGTTVTITGENLSDVTSVYFGSHPALSYGYHAGAITAVTPPGTGSVVVYAYGPCYIGGGRVEFTYRPPVERFAFKGWTLAGSVTPKPLGQPITLPAGSTFSGSFEANTVPGPGSVTGNLSIPPFRAAVKLYGIIPASLGITLTQSGAISGTVTQSTTVAGAHTFTLPVQLKLGLSSLGLLGLNIPTSCSSAQPLSLTLTDTLTPATFASKGWAFSGTTTIPRLSCQGGLLGALYGELISGLISGSGASYTLTVTPPGG
jgi:hypothetical protein